jgi:hypothetical protein
MGTKRLQGPGFCSKNCPIETEVGICDVYLVLDLNTLFDFFGQMGQDLFKHPASSRPQVAILCDALEALFIQGEDHAEASEYQFAIEFGKCGSSRRKSVGIAEERVVGPFLGRIFLLRSPLFHFRQMRSEHDGFRTRLVRDIGPVSPISDVRLIYVTKGWPGEEAELLHLKRIALKFCVKPLLLLL